MQGKSTANQKDLTTNLSLIVVICIGLASKVRSLPDLEALIFA
jgi:hypothetical protein